VTGIDVTILAISLGVEGGNNCLIGDFEAVKQE
jgi:hypothetical protein